MDRVAVPAYTFPPRPANSSVSTTTTANLSGGRYSQAAIVDPSDEPSYQQRPEENEIDTAYIERHVVGDRACQGGIDAATTVDLQDEMEEPKQPLSILDLPPELIFHILSFLPNSRLNINPLIRSPYATSIHVPHDDYNTNANVDPEYHLRTELLDPTPYYPDVQLVQKSLYNVMRSCKRFYEIGKALMWVDVVVKGGRGWISVVEGLGEYVGEVWYDVAASRAQSLVRRSSRKYVGQTESQTESDISIVPTGSEHHHNLMTPQSGSLESSPRRRSMDATGSTSRSPGPATVDIPSPPIVEVAEHMQMLSTSAPVIPQLDQIMAGHEDHTDPDSSPAPHQFPTSVPTSPQPAGPPILAPVLGDISIGHQFIAGFAPPPSMIGGVGGMGGEPSVASTSTQFRSIRTPPGSRGASPSSAWRDNEFKAPVSPWRAAPSLIRRTSSTANRASSLSRGISLVRSKMRDKFHQHSQIASIDAGLATHTSPAAPDAEAEIVVEKEDSRVMRPPMESPDMDFGESQNKFESLDRVLRNGGTVSRNNSISGPGGVGRRSSLRSQSHQTGVVRPKTRLEREKELRRDWERERDLSRARARARSPSVMGGRRARSPSISRSKNRRQAADVGADGAESLMQILTREAMRQESLDGLPSASNRVTAEIEGEGEGGTIVSESSVAVDGLPVLGQPIQVDTFDTSSDTRPLFRPIWNEEPVNDSLMTVEGEVRHAHFPPETVLPEMTPADPEYEFEFELPTRLPPIPQIQSLSFANFRTTGTRRTQEEAVRGKFVTPQRLYHVLRNAPRLKRLAMTEYVDSALAVEVIEEIFLRGYDFGRQGEPEWERQRLSGFEAMEAIDLTGCVSSVFGKALEEFVERWLVDPKERRRRRRQREMDQTVEEPDDRGERGRSRAVHGFGGLTAEDHLRIAEEEDEFYEEEDKQWVKPAFHHLKRFSLRGCVTLSWDVIAAIVGSCPGLTHLDLSFTRVSPATLEALGRMPDARLVSLSLARSTRLTSESVRNFLCDAPAASSLIDLNLFGDMTYLSPLNATDLEWIIRLAPCFQNQQLRYLDLSSSPLTGAMLSAEDVLPQSGLRMLGLSYIPHLPLDDVTSFILKKASNVEILTLTHSSTQADLPLSLAALHTMMTLHGKLINPLTSPPFKIMSGPNRRGPHQDSPTRLRVIELSETVRRALGRSGGSLDWRVIKSKGGRGWFTDISAGWVREHDPALGRRVYRFQRGLDKDHVWRQYLQALADADGKVGSSVGWFPRKMEVLRGLGMIGREEGLFGANSFAFDG